MRPASAEELVGQSHLLGEQGALGRMLRDGHLHSMILWGPPGTGKTTLARLLAGCSGAPFIALSAVLSGVKDIREAVASAQQERAASGRQTVLFIDEVHRFNKAQQDAFLPHVEDGTVCFVGATTENPSFEVNNALLSRARVYALKSLDAGDLRALLRRALQDEQRGLAAVALELSSVQEDALLAAADGDARRLLNLVELAAGLSVRDADGMARLDEAAMEAVLGADLRRFDKGGDAFYEQISALHKSVRGSSPDAALYWLCRMLDGGCDPRYIARRVARMASEDIGNADPRGLQLALNAWEIQERLGSPEGELALAQAVTYLAVAPKSDAVYSAFKRAMQAVREGGSRPVPMHLRNAPTRLMKEMGHGEGYRHAHDEPAGFAAGVGYFPDGMAAQQFYEPVPRGLEISIGERLAELRRLNQQAGSRRKR